MISPSVTQGSDMDIDQVFRKKIQRYQRETVRSVLGITIMNEQEYKWIKADQGR